MTKKGTFKSKGERILHPRDIPNKIGDFLDLPEKTNGEAQMVTGANAPIHNSTSAQNRNSAKSQKSMMNGGHEAVHTSSGAKPNPEEMTRLHVHIRKDLADALLEEVFKRKRNLAVANKDATQRIIIEQALELYFQSQ